MRTRSPHPRILTALVVATTIIAGAIVPISPLRAQSAADIFDQMIERQLDRLSGIENILLEQETMGVVTTVYLVKEMVDGAPVLKPHRTVMGGVNLPLDGGGMGPDAWSGSPRVHRQWSDRFRVDGTETTARSAVICTRFTPRFHGRASRTWAGAGWIRTRWRSNWPKWRSGSTICRWPSAT